MPSKRTYTHAPDDLAAIVLTEPVRQQRHRSYDARSVLLLALVVGSLALVVAGLMNRGEDALPPAPERAIADRLEAGSKADIASEQAPVSSAAAAEGRVDPATSVARPSGTPAQGIALQVGRITATPDAAQGALIIRVAVANAGTASLPAQRAAQLAVLIDSQVIGQVSLGTLAADGGRGVFAISTYACTPGRHVITAIADATSRVQHAAGSNGARSIELTVTCP